MTRQHRLAAALFVCFVIPLPLLGQSTQSHAAPAIIEEARQFHPTSIHIMTYNTVASCLGQDVDVEHLEWWVAERLYNPDSPSDEFIGYFADHEGTHRIYLRWDHVWDVAVIAHEALHDLIDGWDPEAAERCLPRLTFPPPPPAP